MRFREMELSRSFDGSLINLSAAFYAVAIKRYGNRPFLGLRRGFFSRNSIRFVDVRTGYRDYVTGISGAVEIKPIDGYFIVGGPEGEAAIYAYVSNKDQKEIDALFNDISTYLQESSLRRGQAITVGMSGIKFFPLPELDESKLVYNDKVWKDLNAHAWTIIDKPAMCLDAGVKLSRNILFRGKYGSGKTMALNLTARRAIKNDWTFLNMEPTMKHDMGVIDFFLELARKNQPAVAVIEDFDREQREGDNFALGRIMTAIDGTLSKDSKVIVLMTTNFPDRISGGNQRPGRIDRIIDFNTFSAIDIERLLKVLVPNDYLARDINWERVTDLCRDYTPAFIHEVATSAKLVAISESHGEQPVVSEGMLIEASSDLREQHKACSSDGVGFSKS